MLPAIALAPLCFSAGSYSFRSPLDAICVVGAAAAVLYEIAVAARDPKHFDGGAALLHNGATTSAGGFHDAVWELEERGWWK